MRQPKPAPAPYLLAAGRLGLPAETCVVIDDSLNGVRAGKSAGCSAIGLTTSHSAAQLVQVGADWVYASFEEIAAHLLRDAQRNDGDSKTL